VRHWNFKARLAVHLNGAKEAKSRLLGSKKQSAAAASSAPPKTTNGTVMPPVWLFNSPTILGPR
jgi:hypothetical protein